MYDLPRQAEVREKIQKIQMTRQISESLSKNQKSTFSFERGNTCLYKTQHGENTIIQRQNKVPKDQRGLWNHRRTVYKGSRGHLVHLSVPGRINFTSVIDKTNWQN